jgi:hypothetical protein
VEFAPMKQKAVNILPKDSVRHVPVANVLNVVEIRGLDVELFL